MKLLFPFLFALSLGASGARAPAAPDPIRAVLDEQVRAWNRGDIDGFMAGYARSPETTFVSGDAVTHGWQTVRDRYATKYQSGAGMGRFALADLTITRLSPDAAIALGSWTLERETEQLHGKFTFLFRKLPEGWRIVLDHTSWDRPGFSPLREALPLVQFLLFVAVVFCAISTSLAIYRRRRASSLP